MTWGHETIKENEEEYGESQRRDGGARRREVRVGTGQRDSRRDHGEGLQGVTGPRGYVDLEKGDELHRMKSF